MLKRNKIETVGTVREFMTGEYKIKKEINKANKRLIGFGIKVGLATVAGATMIDISVPHALATCGDQTLEAVPVFAGEHKLKETILTAFDPIIDLIKQLAHPIAGIMITTGSLLYMLGRTDKGIDMVQKACVGYVLVQLSDVLLKLIVGIGNAVA